MPFPRVLPSDFLVLLFFNGQSSMPSTTSWPGHSNIDAMYACDATYLNLPF